MRDTVISIWSGTEFKPAKVRWITGAAELLLGLEDVGKLDLEVD